MARTVQPPSGNDFDFPSTSGALTGWTAMLLAVVGAVSIVADRHDLVAARWVLGLALFALVSYAFLLRPRIRVVEGVLHLVNPLEDVRIPLASIKRVTVRSATNVYVGEKRYVGVAVGRRFRQMAGPQGVASPGAGPIGLRRGRTVLPSDSGASTADQKLPDLLEEWVGSRASLARSDRHGRVGGPGDGGLVDGGLADGGLGDVDQERVERVPAWWVLALCGVLAAGLAVTLVL